MKKNLAIDKFIVDVFGDEQKIEYKVKSLREIKNEIKISINDKLSFAKAINIWDRDTGEVYMIITKRSGVEYIANKFYKEGAKLLKICK